jgi:hypothetical protein
VIHDIHQKVYAAASAPGALDMGTWHKCEKTHCWAGWIVTIAGEEGKRLERFFDTPLAAAKICDASSSLPPISPVHFFDDNATALADMKKLADHEAGQP